MTPLHTEIVERIAQDGPIGIDRYMVLCLGHPLHGYYMTRDPLGRAGDFTTAPEISQMFGEMLGVWALSTWDQMGRPAAFDLIELGPGRGTLMADVLRAARALPGFRQAAEVHLVEMSPALRAAQQRTLADCGVPVHWRGLVEEVPGGRPCILLANEFFDALPIRQFQCAGGAWRERLVGLDGDGRLTFGLGEAVESAAAPEGSIREVCAEAAAIIAAVAWRLAADGGALLALDYGYARPAHGDSLQAMRAHAFVEPLDNPGEADLTAHVDFAALAAAAQVGGAVAHPLLSQRSLLERLGIGARAAALAQKNPARAGEIEAAFRRLTGAGAAEMGTLFKALCVSAPGLTPAAFDRPDGLIENR